MAKSKSRSKAREEAVEVLDETVEAPVVEEFVTETAEAAPAVEVVTEQPSITIKVTRDSEGRIIFESEGMPKRIAGSDAVVPEVARQFGEDILKYITF